MVQEFRRIMLTTEELVSAFESYRRITPDFLPDGKVVGCKPVEDGTIVINLETSHGKLTTTSNHTVEGMDTLKPLIRFCLENNIMLPRDGRKSVSMIGDYASLCIALDLSVDVSAYGPPMQVAHLKNLKPADIVRKKANVVAV